MEMPEELVPLIDWWEKDGKKTAAIVAVALVAVVAYKGFVAHREAKRVAAGDAVLTAYSAEQLEDAVSDYAGMAAEGALKLRLAKSCYDAGRYAEAKELYESFGGKGPEGFEDVPAVGIAMCLEGLEDYDGALAAFGAFAEANPDSLYALTAKLGAARIVALKGDRDAGVKAIEALKEEVKDDENASAVVEAMLDTVRRISPAVPEVAEPAVLENQG